MEADDAADSSKSNAAAPITRVIAQRVQTLRTAAGLSGSALAKRMSGSGVKWTRTTVAKFETFQRASITVQELLALSLALQVPPVMLLADPRRSDDFPITDERHVSGWEALLWLVGREEIRLDSDDLRTSNFTDARKVIRAGLQIIDSTDEIVGANRFIVSDDETGVKEWDLLDGMALRRIRFALRTLIEAGAPLPDLDPAVFDRARALGVALPKSVGG
ncbi:MAG: helix-turn-helix domain-containing protein [Pseudonocardia sp.]